jgi:DNA-binding transcriptional LysR family regulator
VDLTAQHLRCFLAVADELNFTRAAAVLHLSPSTVSEQIAGLERRLGVSLFVRTSRSVARTPAAEDLLPLARRAVHAMDTVVDWASSDDVATRVVIGALVSSARFRRLVEESRSGLPTVEWTIRQLGFRSPLQALLDRELDCAFLAELGSRPVARGIATHDLWPERLVLAVREDHPLTTQTPHARLTDLSQETLICGPGGRENPQWFSTIRALVPGSPDVLATARNLEEVVEMCATGIGVAVVSESVMEMFHRPGVAFIPLDDAPTATMRLYCRQGDPSRPLSRLVDLARERYAGD